ncbi:MAG: hypothetical protein M3445_10035 [Actinomycetota bacterium]|nr:hypothetical protein [Actinomycetota bacterium]
MTATLTFSDTLGKHAIELPEGLVAEAEVPVLIGAQAQGDVGVFPRSTIGKAELAHAVKVPAEGIAVVRGEAVTGGNSHILDAYHGDVHWMPAVSRSGGVLLGVLYVPEGSVAMLTHTEEHGSNGIGPGTYRITGKREQADIVRRVAD